MLKKSFVFTALLLVGLPVIPASVSAQTVYKIQIETSFIRASANNDVIEIKVEKDALVVTKVPDHGFYGLESRDRITRINGMEIHTTNAFIDSLNDSKKGVADFQVVRGNQTLTLPIPKKGYSWFL